MNEFDLSVEAQKKHLFKYKNNGQFSGFACRISVFIPYSRGKNFYERSTTRCTIFPEFTELNCNILRFYTCYNKNLQNKCRHPKNSVSRKHRHNHFPFTMRTNKFNESHVKHVDQILFYKKKEKKTLSAQPNQFLICV